VPTVAAEAAPTALLQRRADSGVNGVFVTGTDTGVGKTRVAVALVRELRAHGVDAVGMKPVASGCADTPAGLRNEDAEALREASGLPESDYALVNPVALRAPIAPHLSARAEGRTLSLDAIVDAHAALAARTHTVVVEGVGGWMVPLRDDLLQADLVRTLRLPVLLVVGVRLGCINHALLTARAIESDDLPLLGWVANAIDAPLPAADAAIDAIRSRVRAPLLGCVAAGSIGTAVELADALRALRIRRG
jgi:dethiobiotin synthetase